MKQDDYIDQERIGNSLSELRYLAEENWLSIKLVTDDVVVVLGRRDVHWSPLTGWGWVKGEKPKQMTAQQVIAEAIDDQNPALDQEFRRIVE